MVLRPRSLAGNQFAFYNLINAGIDIVHHTNPKHLILRFELFSHTLCYRHLTYDGFLTLGCRYVNVLEMLMQLGEDFIEMLSEYDDMIRREKKIGNVLQENIVKMIIIVILRV